MNGLILAGGWSRRMGQPKALLEYGGQQQLFRVAALLGHCCERVFVSCRAEQQPELAAAGWTGDWVLDSADLGDVGPINGVLSAFQGHNKAWFVLGCDYPFLIPADIFQLLNARTASHIATAFRNELGMVEPLLSIYEPSAGTALESWVRSGNTSLRVFLEQHSVQLLSPEEPARLVSVDEAWTYERARQDDRIIFL